MTIKPKLLDLCCKAGGCSKGYADAGFDVYGVDIAPQPNYVHPGKFIQADAIEYLRNYGHLFDVVHASPPCQKWSRGSAMQRKKGKEYVDIIDDIRILMQELGKPAIIENVPLSPVRPDIVLRGDLFDLKVIRKRHFEVINWYALQPELPNKKLSRSSGNYICIYGNASWKSSARGMPVTIPTWKKDTIRETWAYAMGIDWYMKDTEIANAIPPAYTKYIGEQLMNYLNNEVSRS